MVLTTKDASYIIVLGIVISILPMISTGVASRQNGSQHCEQCVAYNLKPICWQRKEGKIDFLSSEEKEKWIMDYRDRDTRVATSMFKT
jgi:hypothetical protein